jgi:phage tail sheath protein FI
MKLYDAISTDTQGLVGDSYLTAIALLANPNEYRYNIISAPGLTLDNYPGTINRLIENTEERGDAIVVVDPVLYAKTVTNTISNASTQDSSYAAAYWPWCQTTDPNTGQLVWVPASTMIPGVYAYTDRVSEPWFAPAGINRGGLGTVRQVERKLTQTDKDNLYTGKVNPLATLPGRGVVVYGQKTLQTKPSALDRVNVRRLLISLKSYISQVADNLVFEQNTAATRNQFLSQVNPYLESVQQRQGLYAFKVVMDDTNNTADVIDRNQLVGAIYLQPTKTAEFIYLNFNILPTGATFPG